MQESPGAKARKLSSSVLLRSSDDIAPKGGLAKLRKDDKRRRVNPVTYESQVRNRPLIFAPDTLLYPIGPRRYLETAMGNRYTNIVGFAAFVLLTVILPSTP